MSAGNFIKNAENKADSGAVAADIVGELKKTRASCDKATRAQDQLLVEMEQAGDGMKALEGTIRDFDITTGNLQSDIQKTATEAHKAREAMSEVKGAAEETKKAFSDMPSRAELDKVIAGYIDETLGALHAQDKRLEELNHEVWKNRMKLTAEWGGILSAIVMVVLLLVFFVPKAVKLVLKFMEVHTWALVIFYIIFIGTILALGFLIGAVLESRERRR